MLIRQFIYSSYITPYLDKLRGSSHAEIAAIAARSYPESTYHLRWCKDWLLRLAKGTEDGQAIMQSALDHLWDYQSEFLKAGEFEATMAAQAIAPDLQDFTPSVPAEIITGLTEAGLTIPAQNRNLSGGKKGVHTEHLGYILAEMQFLQRAYPGLEW